MPPVFDNSYARLPERFFARVAPEQPPAPEVLALNRGLAARLGLEADWLAGPEGRAMLAGAALPEGAEPIAQAYAISSAAGCQALATGARCCWARWWRPMAHGSTCS